MDKNLQKAIDIVEQAGGFVMFSDEQLQEIESTSIVDDDYLERKKNAFKELDHIFYGSIKRGKEPSMAEMEDALLENGIDMDELEDWLLNQI